MPVKEKNRQPKRTEFTTSDIIIDVKKGDLYYKSNTNVFKLTGDKIINIQGTLESPDINLSDRQTNIISNSLLFNDNGILKGIDSFKFLSSTTTLDIEANLHIKKNLTFVPSFDNSAGAGTQTPGITLGAEEINESSTTPGSYSGASLILQTPFGKLQIGSRNTGFSHFYTDRDKYYFNRKVIVDEGQVSSYNESLKLMVSGFNTDRSHIVIKNTATDCLAEVFGDLSVKAKGSATGKLTADGDVVENASDKRLKENIIEISNPLDKIQQVRGVYFDWNQKSKEEGFKAAKEKNEIGMIAQEVEQIIPQAIEPAPFNNKYKTIKYNRLIPLLVECIKEQQKQIDELKSLFKP